MQHQMRAVETSWFLGWTDGWFTYDVPRDPQDIIYLEAFNLARREKANLEAEEIPDGETPQD